MKRRLLTGAMLLAPAAAQAHFNIAEAPIGRTDLPWWNTRWHETLAQRDAHPNARIVWLGDSITYYWQRQGGHGYDDIKPIWDKYYAPYGALDFGFIGDTTASLIWRLDHGQVAGLHPKLTIILIGANNFGRPHWDANMTAPAIESVVANTHKRLPDTHILLLGVLPCIRGAWVDEQTQATNAALAKYYDGSQTVSFVDLRHLFIENGKVDAGLYVDPRLTPPEPALHPNREGMTRIAETLAPYVRKYAS
ncbi:GDSL-type esterase/lipase family protein [Acidocella sp.]|uniref:GDSL-type esterase/lipase family protein n=1 Tax=Acidocella sp. TaxID=50710 RepID=UPI003D070F8C